MDIVTSIHENKFILWPLIIGFLLDLLLGDPLWMPHPVRLFGKAIFYLERKLNSGEYKKIKGGLMVVLLVASTWCLFYFGIKLIENEFFLISVISLFFYQAIANRGLVKEAFKVERILQNKGIDAARIQLSKIVGRDTINLSENKIRIAVLETISENLSDGVIAPMFYYAIGGIPLMLTYKMINTLDSMVGYKSKRYKDFGFTAAKLDDFVNYIPARITAILMVLNAMSFRGLKYLFLYGKSHASPNAGMPEAALAGILNCRFGGGNMYHGEYIEKPFIGKSEREIKKADIIKACVLNIASSVSMLLIVFIIILIK